jgi:hypothetical protein
MKTEFELSNEEVQDIYSRAMDAVAEDFEGYMDALNLCTEDDGWTDEDIAMYGCVDDVKRTVTAWCNNMKRDSAYAASNTKSEMHTVLLKRFEYFYNRIVDGYGDELAGNAADAYVDERKGY